MIHLGLIGYPLGHSLSPKIQAAALQACGLSGDYSLFPISPDDMEELSALLNRVRAAELTGLNVTIPHKQNIIPLLDGLTETAKIIGAVNTISLREGRLIGDNTDAPGFLSDLQHFLVSGGFPLESPKSALVLGAGGSARAVVYALASSGWQVSVAARRPEQAREFLDQSTAQVTLHSFSDLTALDLSGYALIVNTTPLGMSPNPDFSPWPDGLPFPRGAFVYDLVYNPRETLFVKQARAAGLPATTGLGMLIGQARLAFEIWTGCQPPREPLFQAVAA